MKPFDPIAGLMLLSGAVVLVLVWLVTVVILVPAVRLCTTLNGRQ